MPVKVPEGMTAAAENGCSFLLAEVSGGRGVSATGEKCVTAASWDHAVRTQI